jgi:YesN/AraC family two-component response regulator
VSIRVLLCDDQALVRGGFQMIIDARDDLEVVGEAENGREAVELTRRLGARGGGRRRRAGGARGG